MASLIRESSGAVSWLFPRNARHCVRFATSPDSSSRRFLKPSGSILVLRRSKVALSAARRSSGRNGKVHPDLKWVLC